VVDDTPSSFLNLFLAKFLPGKNHNWPITPAFIMPKENHQARKYFVIKIPVQSPNSPYNDFCFQTA
jgi:hypothetical protein